MSAGGGLSTQESLLQFEPLDLQCNGGLGGQGFSADLLSRSTVKFVEASPQMLGGMSVYGTASTAQSMEVLPSSQEAFSATMSGAMSGFSVSSPQASMASPAMMIRPPSMVSSPGMVVRGIVSSAPRSPAVTPAMPLSPQMVEQRVPLSTSSILERQLLERQYGSMQEQAFLQQQQQGRQQQVATGYLSPMAPPPMMATSMTAPSSTQVIQGTAQLVGNPAPSRQDAFYMQTVVQPPVTIPYQIQENQKAFPPEQPNVVNQGLTVEQVSVMLQQERSRIYVAMQDIIQQNMKTYSEGPNAELAKIMTMVNAISSTCDERLVRLEVDRAARATTLQGFKRDIDGLQVQFTEMVQSKSGNSDTLAKEREEAFLRIDGITKDMRTQYRSLIAGLNAQREDQGKVDQALVELRREQRSQADKIDQQKDGLLNVQQAMVAKLDKSVSDLRSQVNQSLQAVLAEVESLRSLGSNYGTLHERSSRLEDKTEELYRAFLDQDINELTRVVRAESEARVGLSESLDAYRSAYLQTTTELRAEVDALVEKSTQKGMPAENQARIFTLERSMAEVRNLVSAKAASNRIESRGDQTSLSKDIVDVNGRVSAETAARLELSQSLDAYRTAYLTTTTELRAELDVALEKLMRLETSRRNLERAGNAALDAGSAPKSLLGTASKPVNDGMASWKTSAAK